VNDHGDVVADGEVGELLVRTPTMMAGYWNQPELTERSVRLIPSVGGRSTRWYATGDLLWKGPDDQLHFAGRRDHQVKIRGNRVELEAVEAVLADLPGVAHAVAGVVGLGPDARLIASVVMQESSVLADPQALLRAAGKTLPPYATPDRLFVANEYPLTPSGKIDRRSVRLTFVTLQEQSNV
jgi:acyl-coenzyme A synthetase/AMP-(fatty) acid ligase